jgi:ABC-type dipeptide/oligopeptide/nickel transport system permease subunit
MTILRLLSIPPLLAITLLVLAITLLVVAITFDMLRGRSREKEGRNDD